MIIICTDLANVRWDAYGVIDNLHNRLTFDLGKKNKIF